MPTITPTRDARAAYAISAQQARNLHLAVQGLLNPPRARATRGRLLDAIRRMRLLQIDTINVVARSPYLVLFSRIGDYPIDWLNDLLKRAAIFECWAHEACFAPAEDFALHRNDLSHRAGHWADKSAQRMHSQHRAGMDRVLAYIQEHGEAKASDFEAVRQGGKGWWGWKDEKRWLEALFSMGDLMISRRENFQRVYDLRERVMARMRIAPTNDGTDRSNEFIVGAVRALGITQARWIADYFRTPKKHKDADLQPLVDSGLLHRVSVQGWENGGYVHRDHLPLLERAQKSKLRATHTTLLSPFDPVVWDRARAAAMFDFEYTLECYTPAPKRKYGYFVLPILCRGRLIGRLDAKAHRGTGRFEVKAIYFEEDIDPADDLIADVAAAISASAAWHGTPSVIIRKSRPAHLARKLRESLRRTASIR